MTQVQLTATQRTNARLLGLDIDPDGVVRQTRDSLLTEVNYYKEKLKRQDRKHDYLVGSQTNHISLLVRPGIMDNFVSHIIFLQPLTVDQFIQTFDLKKRLGVGASGDLAEFDLD